MSTYRIGPGEDCDYPDERITLVYAKSPQVCRDCGKQRSHWTEAEQCLWRNPSWMNLWPRHIWISAPTAITSET